LALYKSFTYLLTLPYALGILAAIFFWVSQQAAPRHRRKTVFIIFVMALLTSVATNTDRRVFKYFPITPAFLSI